MLLISCCDTGIPLPRSDEDVELQGAPEEKIVSKILLFSAAQNSLWRKDFRFKTSTDIFVEGPTREHLMEYTFKLMSISVNIPSSVPGAV